MSVSIIRRVHEHEITDVLVACNDGDAGAVDSMVELVYEKLKMLAHSKVVSLPPNGTLNTTALVHEAYLKIGDVADVPWHSRAQFFAIAARAMRLVIVDHARRTCARKRGSGIPDVPLDGANIAVETHAESLLLVDQALSKLSRVRNRLAQVVECRFFAGLSEDETAAALGISSRTVRRDWLSAKIWLRNHIQ